MPRTTMLGTSSEHTYRQDGGEFPPRKKPWAMSQYKVGLNMGQARLWAQNLRTRPGCLEVGLRGGGYK